VTPAQLIEAFDVLADAPDGIARLRELVLQLAVRGQLVPQDPNDEPASVLLKHRISRLEGKSPHELPRGWEWSSFGLLGEVQGGGTPSKGSAKFWGGPIPWVTPKDMKRTQIGESIDTITECALSKSATKLIAEGSLLMVVRGMILAHSFPTALTSRQVTINQDMKALTPFDARLREYLLCASMGHKPRILSLVERSTHGTCKLQTRALLELPIGIPPVAEQHRIVAKVDELMGLLDHLEEAKAKRDNTRAALRDAALSALRDANDAGEVQAAWSRIAENMDDLFTAPADVAPLRQTILQLAVRGRLVPQDPTNPAKRGRVGNWVKFLNGFAFKSEWYSSNGVRVLRNQNIGHGELDWVNEKRVEEAHLKDLKRYRPIIKTGLKVAIVQAEDLPCMLLQRVGCPRPIHDDIYMPYFYTWLQSPEFSDTIEPGRSNGVPHISTNDVERMNIQIPSKEQQHRIVERVSCLMSRCDEFEARLHGAAEMHAALTSAAVHHLDAPGAFVGSA
jgi:type I restriction enzyme S subunit